MAFFRSLSFTSSSSSSSSSSSPPMPPTPTVPPSDIIKESEEYDGLVRFSDSCTLIPASPSSPSILAFLTPTKEKPHIHFAHRHKSCLHNHTRKSSLPSPTFDDPPIVHVPTPVPSRPASPTTRARSSSFLSHFRAPSPPPFLLRSPTLPLRPCCPECAHSFTHPTPKERFTRGARRRQRSASLEPPQTLADKRCSFGAVGMDRHEETVPEDGILLPSITRGRSPARWSVSSTRPTHCIHRPVDSILLSNVAVPGSTFSAIHV